MEYIGKSSSRALLILCMLLALLAGCTRDTTESSSANTVSVAAPAPAAEKSESGSEAAEPLTVGTIARHPDTGTAFMSEWQNTKTTEELLAPDESGALELRCADLSGMDLSQAGELLLNAAFDDQTKWPAHLPAGFDMGKLVEQGKDPGLDVGKLHEQGITGKGVGIAIIDQTLLVDHEEYADRLRLYQEYHTATQVPAQMHGPAVASIALGKTVGVAPEALLYYIADDVGIETEESFIRDMRFYAESVDRLVALNQTLPRDEKTRVISMSVGYMLDNTIYSGALRVGMPSETGCNL